MIKYYSIVDQLISVCHLCVNIGDNIRATSARRLDRLQTRTGGSRRPALDSPTLGGPVVIFFLFLSFFLFIFFVFDRRCNSDRT
jgi:hypothetical protein